jgi:hypothetical protein
MISFCFVCLPPLDLFISKTQSASDPSEACADNWSNMNNVTQLGCASSKIISALLTWASNCMWSHYGSPPDPRYMMHHASLTTVPFSLWMISCPFSSSTKLNTWMMQPQPFFAALFHLLTPFFRSTCEKVKQQEIKLIVCTRQLTCTCSHGISFHLEI